MFSNLMRLAAVNQGYCVFALATELPRLGPCLEYGTLVMGHHDKL